MVDSIVMNEFTSVKSTKWNRQGKRIYIRSALHVNLSRNRAILQKKTNSKIKTNMAMKDLVGETDLCANKRKQFV